MTAVVLMDAEVIRQHHVLSHPGDRSPILSRQPIREQLEDLHGLHPAAIMRWQSHLGQGAQRKQPGPPSAKPASQEELGQEGQEWLGPRHESCSAPLKQAHAATWSPLQPRRREPGLPRHPGGRMRPRRCVLGAPRMFPAYHNYRNICAQQLSVELL